MHGVQVTPVLRLDDPNQLQMVDLEWVEPNEDNVRLFVEKLSLRNLEAIYERWLQDPSTVLPDPPIVRYKGVRPDGTPRLVLLAGERRVTAARNKGVQYLPVRVVANMSDEEAYLFVLRHNDVAGLTTVELAYRAVEMDRLGFSHEEISRELGGVAVPRYLVVGSMVNPDLFTDDEKLCDPSIVEWYEAAQFGKEHFDWCFHNWNAGLWDAEMCAKNFRKRGKALPLDNAEKGFRVTFNNHRLVVRGQCDLSFLDDETALKMLDELEDMVRAAKVLLKRDGNFGKRTVVLINPITVE